MEKLSSKTLKNKNFLHSEDKKENAYKGNNNKSPENKRKNLEDKNIKKKLPFSISDKNVVNNTHKKLKFSQKNKIIFTEFLKRTLIKKGDKELLLIQCLKKEPQTRTKDENNTVRNFLSSSKIVNALLKIQFFEQKNSNNILSSITNELKFTSFKEGQMLFKIGDSIDNFYIIYNGNVLIENLERYSIALSSRQYIKAIIDKYHTLYDYKDEYTLSENNNLFNFKKIIYDEDKRNYSEYILQKIIETNKDIVNIEEDEIKYLNLILLIIDIKNTLNNIFGSYNALLLLIRDYNYDYKKILYDMDYLKNNFFVHSVEINMKQIYKNIPELNPKLVEKYEKIIDNCNNYIFIFFRKGKTTRLQNLGECFGDITPDLKFNTLYENHLKRDYSATALEDTNLANNNILKDNKVKPNIVKSKSSSINHFYNKNNLMNYNNIEEKHTENKNINATLNKMSKFNPFQIKFEENLIKKLKNTLENELLFYYSTKDKPKRNVKTGDTKIKTNKKEKKEISTIIKSDKKEKEISDNNSLYSNVILPYYNSSKNVHNNLEKLIPLELDEIPKKKRFSSRNKNTNLYPLYFTKDNNYLTKDALTINMDNLMKKTLINEQYNKTFVINNINKFNDEEKNELNNSFNKTLYEYKNKTKGYRNFSGINNKLKINIESYGFRGKKYLINYKNDYNKTLYKTIKERVEDNLFMNGQTSSPKINKAYY